jgi:hypothetical protein
LKRIALSSTVDIRLTEPESGLGVVRPNPIVLIGSLHCRHLVRNPLLVNEERDRDTTATLIYDWR